MSLTATVFLLNYNFCSIGSISIILSKSTNGLDIEFSLIIELPIIIIIMKNNKLYLI